MRTSNIADIGALRHRVQIVKSTVSAADGLGGGTRTDTVIATVWARIDPTSAQEHDLADGLRAQTWWRVQIRYPDSFTVTADMRLLVGGKTLHIRGIMQPDLVNRWLKLICLEGE